MKIAPLAEVKARLRAYVDHVETAGPVVITRNVNPRRGLVGAARCGGAGALDVGAFTAFPSLVGPVACEHRGHSEVGEDRVMEGAVRAPAQKGLRWAIGPSRSSRRNLNDL